MDSLQVEKRSTTYWDGLLLTIYLRQPLNARQRERLEGVIDAWYSLGVLGAFGGSLHNATDLEDGSENGQHFVELSIDMGSSHQNALDILLRALEGCADAEGVLVDRVALGERDNEG